MIICARSPRPHQAFYLLAASLDPKIQKLKGVFSIQSYQVYDTHYLSVLYFYLPVFSEKKEEI